MDGSKVLLVTATGFEVEPTLEFFGCRDPRAKGLGVAGAFIEHRLFDCLVTGVGQLQCAAHLMARLSVSNYAFVVQAGLAGSFSSRFRKGSVVLVGEEQLGDCGAETGEGFLDLAEMGLLPKNSGPFVDGLLRAAQPAAAQSLGLPTARSVTVNRTLADRRSIEWVRQRYSPDVVNMEGAALFYVCLLRGVACAQIRGVSDMVGPRDKAAWDIPGAIQALNSYVIRLLSDSGLDSKGESP